jgi:acyl-CoA dehydrogenase
MDASQNPDAGSDVAAITSTARLDGDHYLINGRKTWTSNAGLADLYVVFARIEGGAGSAGISAFAVDGDQDGIGLEELLSVLPPHTVGTWTLHGTAFGISAIRRYRAWPPRRCAGQGQGERPPAGRP